MTIMIIIIMMIITDVSESVPSVGPGPAPSWNDGGDSEPSQILAMSR